MANNFDISFDYSLDTKSYTSGGVTFTGWFNDPTLLPGNPVTLGQQRKNVLEAAATHIPLVMEGKK